MKQLLILTPEPIQGASSRLRAIDLIPFWSKKMKVRHLAFLSPRSYQLKDRPGRLLSKVVSVLFDSVRFTVLFPYCLYTADVVLVHRNVAPIGPPIFEWLAKTFSDKFIYDFDDAIYLNPATARNRWLGPLKMNAFRTRWLTRSADIVVVGNQHLASYAKQFNDQVLVVPTGLDVTSYVAPDSKEGVVVIGWIGGPGTAVFVQQIIPVLVQILNEHPAVEVHLVGDDFGDCHARLKSVVWTLDSELACMQAFSIGINPLQNNAFTLGKCGFKVIQYHALGIPAISSPVGVCEEQIEVAVNGYFATSDLDWYEALSLLVSDEALRLSMGKAAKASAEHYQREGIAQQVLEQALLS
ncbi:MAG: glycosyltransferase involved in cell wall biosynthesis [Candidatus Azotimanducaceae bacterium]|jgi:glycosyltransferase involved in cell wall biosynthesis